MEYKLPNYRSHFIGAFVALNYVLNRDAYLIGWLTVCLHTLINTLFTRTFLLCVQRHNHCFFLLTYCYALMVLWTHTEFLLGFCSTRSHIFCFYWVPFFIFFISLRIFSVLFCCLFHLLNAHFILYSL